MPRGKAKINNYAVTTGGQLEIKDLDTELGRKANEFLEANAKVSKSKEYKKDVEKALIAEIKKAGLRKLKIKGVCIKLSAGKIQDDKLTISEK